MVFGAVSVLHQTPQSKHKDNLALFSS